MYYLIMCTCPNMDQAREITKLLLDKQLAACVNIIPSIESHFVWDNKIQTQSEVLLLIKTTEVLYAKVEQIIQSNHDYKCPEIIAINIAHGYEPYLKWLKNSTCRT